MLSDLVHNRLISQRKPGALVSYVGSALLIVFTLANWKYRLEQSEVQIGGFPALLLLLTALFLNGKSIRWATSRMTSYGTVCLVVFFGSLAVSQMFHIESHEMLKQFGWLILVTLLILNFLDWRVLYDVLFYYSVFLVSFFVVAFLANDPTLWLWGRLAGPYNPNNLASTTVVLLPFVVFTKRKVSGWVKGFLGVALVAILFATKSRTGQLIFLLYCLVMLFRPWMRPWSFDRRGLMMALGLLFMALPFSDFVTRWVLRGESYSAFSTFTGRTLIWQSYLKRIWEHPWVGLGDSSPMVRIWEAEQGGYSVPYVAHNFILDLAVRHGVVIALVFSMVLGLTVAIHWSRLMSRRVEEPQELAVCVLVSLAMVIDSTVNHGILGTYSPWAVGYWLVAIRACFPLNERV